MALIRSDRQTIENNVCAITVDFGIEIDGNYETLIKSVKDNLKIDIIVLNNELPKEEKCNDLISSILEGKEITVYTKNFAPWTTLYWEIGKALSIPFLNPNESRFIVSPAHLTSWSVFDTLSTYFARSLLMSQELILDIMRENNILDPLKYKKFIAEKLNCPEHEVEKRIQELYLEEHIEKA